MALTVTNDSPSDGYIAWADLTITYKGSDYSVNDGNSNKKYLWWDLDNPTDLQETDSFPPLEELEDALVFLNEDGEAKYCLNQTIIHGDQITEQSITEDQLAVGAAMPVGAMLDYPVVSPPDGFLLCNGQSLLRSEYENLFDVIGTTYGSEDASHFTLPDIRNRFVVGAGDTYSAGDTGGSNSVTLTTSQLPSHTHGSAGGHSHSYTKTNATTQGQYGTDRAVIESLPTANTSSAGGHTHSSVGSGDSHENRPPYLALYKIIKY